MGQFYVFQSNGLLKGGLRTFFRVGKVRYPNRPVLQTGVNITQMSRGLILDELITLEPDCTLYGVFDELEEATELAVSLTNIQLTHEA